MGFPPPKQEAPHSPQIATQGGDGQKPSGLRRHQGALPHPQIHLPVFITVPRRAKPLNTGNTAARAVPSTLELEEGHSYGNQLDGEHWGWGEEEVTVGENA